MKKLSWIFALVFTVGLFSGCRTGFVHPSKKTDRIQLGMTPQEVVEELGRPYTIRSAKVFENEETTMVWEYWPPFLSGNQTKVHIFFENGQLVQWGQPGDFGTANFRGNLSEYKPGKSGR